MNLTSNTTTRKISLSRISLNLSSNIDYTDHIFLEQLLSNFFIDKRFKEDNNKFFDMNNSKRFWINNITTNTNEFFIELEYALHNKQVSIVDVDTKKIINKKDFKHGDLEKQYFYIKIIPGTNNGILAFEKIHNSITENALKEALNSHILSYLNCNNLLHINNINKVKVNVDPIIDGEFLTRLSELNDGISLIKATVYSDSLSADEDLMFSGSNRREVVELVQKPTLRQRFKKRDVIKYCDSFVNDGKISNRKVKKLIIHGYNEKNKVRLDSDQMKLIRNVEVNLNVDNTINSEHLHAIFSHLVSSELNNTSNFMDATLEIAQTME